MNKPLINDKIDITELRIKASNNLDLLGLLARFNTGDKISMQDIMDSFNSNPLNIKKNEAMILLINEYAK